LCESYNGQNEKIGKFSEVKKGRERNFMWSFVITPPYRISCVFWLQCCI